MNLQDLWYAIRDPMEGGQIIPDQVWKFLGFRTILLNCKTWLKSICANNWKQNEQLVYAAD